MSTTLDLTEAIHTAAWAIDPVDGMEDEGRDALTAAIVAAAPLIERQVRERIAAEQEAWRDGATEDGANLYTDTPYGIASALIRIARGES